jgi:gamma-D-glutamyl-L-lysine dipeptidyl-peptidase
MIMQYFSKYFTKKIFFGIFCLCLCFWQQAFAAAISNIRLPVANLYVTPSENAAIATQAIYAAPVKILENRQVWVLVETDDGYHGWIKSSNLGVLRSNAAADMVQVANVFAYIYREADTTLHAPLVLAPFGTRLPLIDIQDQRWLKVQLVDGSIGWIQQGDVEINPKPLTMEEMLTNSNNFIGLPYLWAGTSTFGFDCSGFVQFLYRQIGIIIPRDANQQVQWPPLQEVAREDLKPGDLLYLGWNNVISHAGVYLGKDKFIHATAHADPSVQIGDLRDEYWNDIFITARRYNAAWQDVPKFVSHISALSQDLQDKMMQYTWHTGCPLPLSDLASVEVSYWDFNGKVQQGALIVHKKLAPEVAAIFEDLYTQRFPIERITPIENYQGDDNKSMLDNNTSAFNCRAMTDFPDKFSIHSYGAAIDINPLINPYVAGDKVPLEASAAYADRSAYHKGKITLGSSALEAFTKRGWIWGGSWKGNVKDYQHFEKRL